MITLNYSISEQEYKDFYFYLGWQSPERKSYRLKYHLSSIGTYLLLLLLLIWFKGTQSFTPFSAIIFGALLVGLYFYTNYRMKTHFYNAGKKVYDDSDKENSEMIIGEAGIFAKSKDTDAHYRWSAFAKKYETANAFYLYMTNNLALIIPKRVFNSTVEKEAFEKILTQYLPLQADLPTAGK